MAKGTMDEDLSPDSPSETERISTGNLPSDSEVRGVMTAGYERFLRTDEGTVADYIPALAQAPSTAFGVCVAGVHGRLFAIGDAELEFSIQSISKIFVLSLVCDVLG